MSKRLLTCTSEISDNGHMQALSSPAILFDLDGTLVDTVDDIAQALNKGLALEGLAPLDGQATKKVVGRGLRNALLGAIELQGKRVDESRFEHMYTTMMEHYQQNPCVKSTPYEGVIPLLDTLNQHGFTLGVLSNKEDSLTQEIVHTLFGPHRFVWVRGMRSDVPRKPDKAALVYFAQKEGFAVEQLLYVGDSEVDYQTAVNAECKHVLVTWGFRPREELALLEGSVLVDSVDELQEAIYDLQ